MKNFSGSLVEGLVKKYAKGLFPNDPDDIMIATPYNNMGAFFQ
ncbi:MAG: hypothetical protein Ct9H300mP18_05990 [Candidatus Neomarinimicrobiota bacterium]|nr:MAG: hypothetical protein Ct9H300mP18_05990 [Candidatus Neomarinimicrobiota bacterium]